jgi:hypothetical protein
MSEEIFSVVTPFPDVAALAQGYMNRADGERLLLPLPEACSEGSGLRFVVYLSDGTPAFAGAGLCAQTSDQGGTVPPEQRFETLLDSLQFDERSRPVYDYIVAVRNAAYAQPAEDAALAAEVETAEVASYEAGTEPEEPEEEATQFMGRPARESEPAPATMIAGTGEQEMAYEVIEGEVSTSTPAPPVSIPAPASIAPASFAMPDRMPSFVPPPIPTGLLMRPARATHWQPAPPRRPTPRPSTGLFRYGPGGLPRPAQPPRPDIDPAQQIKPAPHP